MFSFEIVIVVILKYLLNKSQYAIEFRYYEPCVRHLILPRYNLPMQVTLASIESVAWLNSAID